MRVDEAMIGVCGVGEPRRRRRRRRCCTRRLGLRVQWRIHHTGGARPREQRVQALGHTQPTPCRRGTAKQEMS